MKWTHWIRAAAFAAILCLLPMFASAQDVQLGKDHDKDDDKDGKSGVIHACYIPGSGTVYRIKGRGLPDECRGHHIEFSFKLKGDKGDHGDDGEQGPPGPPGPVGPAGPAGADGTNGTNGVDGAPGATGPAGADGTNGTNGTNGVDGATGATGPAGTDGLNGTNGTNGVDGTNGTNGTNGVSGREQMVAGAILPQAAGPVAPFTVDCNAGKSVLGGGYVVSGDPNGRAMQSSPTITANGWTVTWVVGPPLPGPPLPRNITVYAICAQT